MKVITIHEAKTHLSRYIKAVESGEEMIISRGKEHVAMLIPISNERNRTRPKVGEIEGEPFHFPDSAFEPLSSQELEDWGL